MGEDKKPYSDSDKKFNIKDPNELQDNDIKKLELIISSIIKTAEQFSGEEKKNIIIKIYKHKNRNSEIRREINLFNKEIESLLKSGDEPEIFERIKQFKKNIINIVNKMFDRETLGEIYLLFPDILLEVKKIWAQKSKEKKDSLKKLKKRIIEKIIMNVVSYLFINFGDNTGKLILKETKKYYYL